LVVFLFRFLRQCGDRGRNRADDIVDYYTALLRHRPVKPVSVRCFVDTITIAFPSPACRQQRFHAQHPTLPVDGPLRYPQSNVRQFGRRF